MVKQHIAAGADVNVRRGRLRLTPLHLATGNGRKEVSELLIAAGADVNATDRDGNNTPLNWAKNKPEIADLLRKHAARQLKN